MLTTSAKWDSLVHTHAEMITVVRMYYGDETDGVDFVGLSTAPVVIDGRPYLPLIQKHPRIQSKITVEGNVNNLFKHSLSGDSLIIDNLALNQKAAPGERFTDAMDDITSGGAHDIGFYNRKIEIRRWLKGMTTWTDGLAVMGNPLAVSAASELVNNSPAFI